MKSKLFIFTNLLISITLFSWIYIQKENIVNQNDNTLDSLPDTEEDVLEDFLFINADSMPQPSTNFRPGHVAEIDLNDYFQKTENGYSIQLPQLTNMPSPSYQDGKLYVSGGFGSREYYAFDAKRGDNLWAITLDDDGPSTAAIEDGIIVFNTESCTIFACNLETGEHLWSYWLGDPLMSMPAIANGKVFTSYPAMYHGGSAYNDYYQNNDYYVEDIYLYDQVEQKQNNNFQSVETKIYPSHVFAAFDLYTGEVLWQKWIDGDVMSAPVVKDGNVHVTTFSGTLLKFDENTGDILSAKATRATSAPVLVNDGIFLTRRAEQTGQNASESIVSFDQRTQIIDKEYGERDAPYLDKQVQSHSKMAEESLLMDAGNGFGSGAPSSANADRAYGIVGQTNVSSLQAFQGSRVLNYKGWNYNTMGNELICSNPETGEESWKMTLDGDMENAGGFMGTPPIGIDNYVIVATFTGDILIINKKDGSIEEKYETDFNFRTQPIVAKGWIYATATNGKLIAIDTGNKKLDGWYTWGANAARTNEL